MVRVTGLEPVRRSTHAPQTCLSTSSSTLAFPVVSESPCSQRQELLYQQTPVLSTEYFIFFRKIFTDAKNAGKGGPSPAFSAVLRTEPHLKPQPIGNHRDKLAVSRLALDAGHRVAEVALQRFDVAAVKMSDFCNKKLVVINCKINSLLG